MDKELATSCSVFAVWRWKWWAWIPATVLVFAVYVLSATPMWWLSFNLSSKIDSDVPYRVYSLT